MGASPPFQLQKITPVNQILHSIGDHHVYIQTLSDYDATAHISEEIRNPAVVAPLAIVTAVGVTGVLGWFLNLVLVLYSPDLAPLTASSTTTSQINDTMGLMSNITNVYANSSTPQNSQSSSSDFLLVATILSQNLSTVLFYFTWTLICINAFFQVNVVLQACSRTLFAFSRDGGLPDGQFFGKLSDWTRIPLRAVWVVILISLFFGSLDFVSTVAVNAVFRWAASCFYHSFRKSFIFRSQRHFSFSFFFFFAGLLIDASSLLSGLFSFFPAL
jgi:amino acid transporter